MNNRRGFTLIELLATIVIIGLVLSIGGYFVFKAVDSSKNKALEITKNSVYKSATSYADEFLSDTDWKENIENNSSVEKTCINIKWLINKGYQKKEDFLQAGESDKYKLNSSDIVILKRNPISKVITPEGIYNYEQVNKEICTNILSGSASISQTTNSITVIANCKIKSTIPNDIKYEYCINHSCANSNKSTHIFTDLTDNTTYSIDWSCNSSQGDYSDSNDVATLILPTPSCIVDENSKVITISSNSSYNYVNKKIKVNKDNFTVASGEVNELPSDKKLVLNKEYTYTSSKVIIYFTKITEDAILTVSNTDGNNIKTGNCNITKPISSSDINTPIFIASDEISSNNWHKNDFILSLSSGDTTGDIEYYYGTDSNDITAKYTEGINITNEDTITYYAKACIGGVNGTCSGVTSYIAKLDKTSPSLSVEMNNHPNNLSCRGNSCTNDIWLNNTVTLKFTSSDNGSGLNTSTTFSHNATNLISPGNLTSSSTKTLATDGTISINITGSGSRYVALKVCDNAGNCTTQKVYFKLDNIAPIVDVTMNYTDTNISIPLTTNGNVSTNDKWLNKLITLYFASSDSLSGIDSNAIFSYNQPYQKEENKSIVDSSTVTLINGNFIRPINSYGNRYITLKLCDNAGNCATKEVKFKIDTENPIVTYIGRDSSDNNYVIFKCESLSGVNKFITTDSVNGTSTTSNSEIRHWWGTSNDRTKIDITCRNNANVAANYTYERKTSNETYKRCQYVVNRLPLTNFSICVSPETACNGTHKKYTNCTVENPNGVLGSDGNRYIGYYYVWDWYYYTGYSETELLSFVNSSKG